MLTRGEGVGIGGTGGRSARRLLFSRLSNSVHFSIFFPSALLCVGPSLQFLLLFFVISAYVESDFLIQNPTGGEIWYEADP
jgi:hypothetical protein